MIKQRIHDSMTFFWTSDAVQSDAPIIGFYFDHLNRPQSVHRASIYGSHILRWDAEV